MATYEEQAARWAADNALKGKQEQEWLRHEIEMASIERNYALAKAGECRRYSDALKTLEAEYRENQSKPR